MESEIKLQIKLGGIPQISSSLIFILQYTMQGKACSSKNNHSESHERRKKLQHALNYYVLQDEAVQSRTQYNATSALDNVTARKIAIFGDYTVNHFVHIYTLVWLPYS